MAPGARRKGGRGSGQGGGRKSGQPSGIEKYGQDEVDEFLNLDDGDAPSEAESDVCEEEDVMAIEGEADAEDHEDWERPKGSSKAKVSSDDKWQGDEEDKLEPASKGWRRNEFYGGDDAGDDSDVDSDEDLVFQEAKRLEELRASQLTGGDDVLAALLAKPTGAEEDAPTEATVGPAPGGPIAGAQFESVFAGEAEKVSVPRDLSELPASERRGLIKKEAPELMPLLSDFKAKLASLQELLPLLQPAVRKDLPASGAAYVEAKATLLLNNLANLSFYLLLRAEGGAVRAHPVIPQLVWLRELHEQLSPLDEKLGSKVRKALGAAKQALQNGAPPQLGYKEMCQQRLTALAQAGNGRRTEEAPAAPRKKTLRERLERLQLPPALATGKVSTKKQSGEEPLAAKLNHGLLTKDLLRLPKARPTANSGVDLVDDVDPTLGVWAPKSSLGEQLSSVQQQLGEHAKRAKAARASADQNTEARPRRARERKDNLHPEPPADAAEAVGQDDEDEDENELIKNARLRAKSKKERKSKIEETRAAQKEEARRLKEFQPELEAEGRRKTSKRILTNRGLGRVRKKKAGNARVSNKHKYEKSLKRRKGAVQDMRQGEADGATYDGEATGIRTHVRKSQKIN